MFLSDQTVKSVRQGPGLFMLTAEFSSSSPKLVHLRYSITFARKQTNQRSPWFLMRKKRETDEVIAQSWEELDGEFGPAQVIDPP